MNGPYQITPLITMLRRGDRSLTVKTPHCVQKRFQPNATLVDRPEFSRRLRGGGGDFAQQGA
jgi:hypothetical protein